MLHNIKATKSTANRKIIFQNSVWHWICKDFFSSNDLEFLHAFKVVIHFAQAESEPQVIQLLTRLIIDGKN